MNFKFSSRRHGTTSESSDHSTSTSSYASTTITITTVGRISESETCCCQGTPPSLVKSCEMASHSIPPTSSANADSADCSSTNTATRRKDGLRHCTVQRSAPCRLSALKVARSARFGFRRIASRRFQLENWYFESLAKSNSSFTVRGSRVESYLYRSVDWCPPLRNSDRFKYGEGSP